MFGKAIVAVALAAVAVAQDPTIESPASLVQCQPTLIKWNTASSPAFISIIPGNQSGAAPLIDFGEQSGNQLTWNVNITAGTSVTYKITNAKGETNYNSAVTIQPGSDSCLNAAAGGAASGASSASGAVASGASSTAGAASSAASSGTSAAGGAASSASSAAQSATSAAGSAASSAASNARSAGSSATSAAGGAASSAAPSNAASPFAAADLTTGAIAVFLGALGLTAF